jgi:Protein of unknown function (DUF2917)
MNTEDSMHFVQERLRHHSAIPFTLTFGASRPRVTRRLAVQMAAGEARTFERVDGSVCVHCTEGSLWITHDGDPKDVILNPRESYRAEREDAMHVFALQPCVLEIEFEDEMLNG